MKPWRSAGPWRPTTRGHLLLAAYWFPLSVQTTALTALLLPRAVLGLAGGAHVAILGRLSAAGAALAMVVPPLAGAASDRLRRTHGSPRWPLILAGAALNLAGLGGMAAARSTATLAAGFGAAVVGSAVSVAAYQALLPDLVPPRQRGTAAGYRAVANLTGTMAGLVLGAAVGGWAGYGIVAGTVGAGAAATAAGVPERAPGGAGAAAEDEGGEGSPSAPPRADGPPEAAPPSVGGSLPGAGHRNFALVFTGRFFTYAGLTLLTTFGLYFFRDAMHASNPSALVATVGLLGAMVAAATSVAAGRLFDRVSRSRATAASGVPLAVAAFAYGFLQTPGWAVALAVLFGIGYGAYSAADWALVVDVLPSASDSARDMGAWGIAAYLPGVVAPVAGAWIVQAASAGPGGPAAGYRLLFVTAGLCFAAGSAAVLFVRGLTRPGGGAGTGGEDGGAGAGGEGGGAGGTPRSGADAQPGDAGPDRVAAGRNGGGSGGDSEAAWEPGAGGGRGQSETEAGVEGDAEHVGHPGRSGTVTPGGGQTREGPRSADGCGGTGAR